MPSLKDIRGRIGSVRNIAQITRAMEMVAASRMKRAQDAILAARPYSDELRAALSRVAAVVGEVSLITVGRKGRDALRRSGIPIAAHFAQLGTKPSFSDITPLARLIVDDFLEGTYDEIDLVYSSFVSTLVQRPEVKQLLPIARPTQESGEEENDEYLFEPSPEAVLSRLLPHYVAIDIYRAVLENNASEQSAQMIAMRNATDNAHELIDDLTLVYNKTRQATITREMIEIASGAEALGG